jgi:Holliday junction resolvase
MKIVKASGKETDFKAEKIIDSSMRAGASKDLAKNTAEEVEEKIHEGSSTQDVYENVLQCLRSSDKKVAARYSLKKAIMRLGPAGYVFERYLGAILSEYGYKVAVGIIVEGHCISHEVDVVALNNSKHIIAEAKYHNRPGIHSGAKDALYTWSRFQDIEKKMSAVEKNKKILHESWLVTNTKVSSDVRAYAKCVGMHVVSWKYGTEKSLRELIEDKFLYPITIIPSLSYHELERLSRHKTIFALDLRKYSAKKIAHISGMKENKAQKVLEEMESICV